MNSFIEFVIDRYSFSIYKNGRDYWSGGLEKN